MAIAWLPSHRRHPPQKASLRRSHGCARGIAQLPHGRGSAMSFQRVSRSEFETNPRLTAWLLAGLAATCLALTGCVSGADDKPEKPLPLKLDPDFVNPNDPGDAVEPAKDYTLFEVDLVRPIAVLDRSGMVAVTNTEDDFLEFLVPDGPSLRACGSVKVGMRPVAAAVISERGDE